MAVTESSLLSDHASYSRFYLPRLREWSRDRCGADSVAGGFEDDRITSLVLDGKNATDVDCAALADAIRVNGSLTYLSTAGNPAVTARGITAIADAVASHPRMAVWRIVGESDTTGPDSDVAPADLDDPHAAGRLQVDANCAAWFPEQLQGTTEPVAETELRAFDLPAMLEAYEAIAQAALKCATLRRLFLPPAPSLRVLCAITGSEVTLSDEDSFFGTPDEKDAKRELLRQLRTIAGAVETATAAVKLNMTTGGAGNWKRCFVAAVSNSTVLADASHDLSKGGSTTAVGLTSAPALRFATKLVSAALVRAQTIRRVDISGFGSWMGDSGAEVVAATLFSAEANQVEGSALTELNLSENDITGRGALALFNALASGGGNRTLIELDLTANRVTDNAAQRLLELVRKCAFALAYVGIDRNCVTPNIVAAVMQNLALNSQPPRFRQVLQELEADNVATTRAVFNQQASSVRLNDISCRLMMHALRPNTRIVHIDVSANDIGDEGAMHLAEIVAGNRTLRKLIAQSNRITDDGAALLLAAIPRNPAIETVDVSDQRPPISDAMLDRLRWLSSLNTHPVEIKTKGLLILQNDPSLTSIRIAGYDGQRRLTETSVAVLCEMLSVNHVVNSLTIANHPPSEKIDVASTLPSIASLVAHKLTHLDLSNNALNDGNALEVVSQMLADPKSGAASLKTLVLANNDFSANAAAAFAETLRTRNDSLTTLDLSGNRHVSDVEQHNIDFAAQLNLYGKEFKTLVLNVDSNVSSVHEVNLKQVEKSVAWGASYHFVRRYDDRAACLLAEALMRNGHVTSVDFSGNEIRDEGASALAEMLKVNVSVTALHLAANDISDEGLAALQRGLLEAHNLRVLSFEGNRRAKDPAIRKSIQLSLAQNAQSNKDEHMPKTAAIYSSALSGKRAKLQRAAADDRIVDDAIFEDAMADFHAAERRKAAKQREAAEDERRKQETALREQHAQQLGPGVASAEEQQQQESSDQPAAESA